MTAWSASGNDNVSSWVSTDRKHSLRWCLLPSGFTSTALNSPIFSFVYVVDRYWKNPSVLALVVSRFRSLICFCSSYILSSPRAETKCTPSEISLSSSHAPNGPFINTIMSFIKSLSSISLIVGHTLLPSGVMDTISYKGSNIFSCNRRQTK